MLDDSKGLLILAFALTILGVIAGLVLSYRAGYVDFIGRLQWYALFVFLIGGILYWYGMILSTNAFQKKFEITSKQYVSLVISILMAILYWGRYVYTISGGDNEKKAPKNVRV